MSELLTKENAFGCLRQLQVCRKSSYCQSAPCRCLVGATTSSDTTAADSHTLCLRCQAMILHAMLGSRASAPCKDRICAVYTLLVPDRYHMLEMMPLQVHRTASVSLCISRSAASIQLLIPITAHVNALVWSSDKMTSVLPRVAQASCPTNVVRCWLCQSFSALALP